MRISGIQKVTLTDYPKHLACIIFTQGCNYNCGYCQNRSLISQTEGLLTEEYIFEYLNKRKNLLEGVVVSGGEPTIQKDLKEFIKKVKKLGLKVKLDTNGSNYKIIDELLKEQLVDYIAMDIKGSIDNYNSVCGSKVNVENIRKSIKRIKNSNIDYEFRTTIIKEYHNLSKIKEIISIIENSKYYIQNYEESERVLDKSLHSFTEEELKELKRKLKIYPNVKIRGLE